MLDFGPNLGEPHTKAFGNGLFEPRLKGAEARMKEIQHADPRCHPELQPGEILTAVHIARMRDGAIQHFEKVGLRNALDDGGHVEQTALAWGSVGPTVVRGPEAERHLIGRP